MALLIPDPIGMMNRFQSTLKTHHARAENVSKPLPNSNWNVWMVVFVQYTCKLYSTQLVVCARVCTCVCMCEICLYARYISYICLKATNTWNKTNALLIFAETRFVKVLYRIACECVLLVCSLQLNSAACELTFVVYYKRAIRESLNSYALPCSFIHRVIRGGLCECENSY